MGWFSRVLAAAARNLVNTSHETQEVGLGTQAAGGSTPRLRTVRARVLRADIGVQAQQQVSTSTVLVAELPSMQILIYIPNQTFSCSSQTPVLSALALCVRCQATCPTAAMPPPSQCPQQRLRVPHLTASQLPFSRRPGAGGGHEAREGCSAAGTTQTWEPASWRPPVTAVTQEMPSH